MPLEVIEVPERLREWEPPRECLCVLPERLEEGHGVYRSELTSLLPYLRSEGVDGAFVHTQENRVWRDLKGPVEIAFALSIAANIISSVAWDGIKAAFAAWMGSHQGSRLEIDVVIPRDEAEPVAVHISGDSGDVNEALDRLPETIRQLGSAAKKAK